MSVLLGADVGGSHTSVALARPDLTILARTEGPGIVMRAGTAAAVAAVIKEAASRAATQAGTTLPIDRAAVGAAGAGRESEQEELARALATSGVARQVIVRGDGEIALLAAFGSAPEGGIFLNAGTGSIAYARDAAGAIHRSGGYGWQLGDEGGGYWLGRRALEIAGRAYDGRGEGSTLLTRILTGLGLRSFDGLIRWAAGAAPGQVAALAPQLVKAAREGELVAQQALGEAATALVAIVGVLMRHFPKGKPVAVALGGGLLQEGSPLSDAVRAELARSLPDARVSEQRVDPLLGALRLAGG